MKLFGAMLVAILAVSVARADTIVFNNLGGAPAGVDCVSSIGTGCGSHPPMLFDSFTAVAGKLTGLKLILQGDPTSNGTLDIGLYANIPPLLPFDNPAAGALITTLGTLSDSSLSSVPTTHDIPLAANPTLAATRYWIGLTGTTTAGWSWSMDVSGAGCDPTLPNCVADEWLESFGVFPNPGNGPYQMELTELAAPPIPEPGTLVLLGSGLAGVAGVLRRKLHR